MKKLVLTGKRDAEREFTLTSIQGRGGGSNLNEWVVATNVLRMMRGEADKVLRWGVGQWGVNIYGNKENEKQNGET